MEPRALAGHRSGTRRRLLIPKAPPALRVPHGSIEHLGGHTMGTTWSIRAALLPGEVETIRSRVEALLTKLVADLSHWDPGSALCRYNRAPAESWVAVPLALEQVLVAGLAIARATEGAFDPTLGPLIDLWGFGPPGPITAPPDPVATRATAALCGWQRLFLDTGRGCVWQPGGLCLDLSGIAKGYAVDRVSQLLHECGVTHHLVEIGGELRGSGVKPDGSPWWVILESLDDEAETVVGLYELSVATSGQYRRGFDYAGRCYGHTLDTKTASPITAELAGVSVLHSSCMLADAYATALLALGPLRAATLAAEVGLAARFLSADRSGCVEELSPVLQAMSA